MSDLFQRLNPFRPQPQTVDTSPIKPSPRTTSSSTAAISAPSPVRRRPKTPLHLHLPTARTPGKHDPFPSRPSSSLESSLPLPLPLPDGLPAGQYYLDTQRSLDLDRPVFTPVPPSPLYAHAPYTYDRAGSKASQTNGNGRGGQGWDGEEYLVDDDEREAAVERHEPVTPTHSKRSKTPSILRSLAHHPSLSALKSKSRRGKKKERPPLPSMLPQHPGADTAATRASEYGTVTPGAASVDDEVYEDDEGVGRGFMGTWGSARKSKSKLRKGSLKAVKSVPDGLRLSSESNASASASASASDYRPSVDAPVPALPESFLKRTGSTAKAIDFSRARTPEIEISLDGHQCTAPISPEVRRIASISASPPKADRRYRGKSEDLSPQRHRGGPRHLSSPARADRIKPISPPRYSMPSTSQHPHPVPLDWAPRRTSEDEEYDPDRYGDRPGRQQDDIAGIPDIDDALEMMRPSEELPRGTPGGSKKDREQGILKDGKRPEKGALRFFSRDTYPTASPTESPSSTPCPTPTNLLPVRTTSATPSFSERGRRSESPFEVKLSPMVTKRMSLDAFGPTTHSSSPPPAEDDSPNHGARGSPQSIPESVEELVSESGLPDREDDPEAEDAFELDSAQGTPQKYEPMPNTLEGWTGTQLTTIEESPASARQSCFSDSTPPIITAGPSGVPPTGHTMYFTPPSGSTTSGATPSTDSPLMHKHLSAPPLPTNHLMRSVVSANDGRLGEAEKRAAEAEGMAQRLREEVQALRDELAEGERENEAAWKVVEEAQEQIKEKDRHLADKQYALEQMRQAMSENEEFFEQLQDAHDRHATEVSRLQAQLDEALEGKVEAIRTAEALRIASERIETRHALLEAELSGVRSDAASSHAALLAAGQQLETFRADFAGLQESHQAHLEECTAEIAQLRLASSEQASLQTLLSLRESDEARRVEMELELRTEVKTLQRQAVERETMMQVWKDKVATKQFELDEWRVYAEIERKDLRARAEDAEGAKERAEELAEEMKAEREEMSREVERLQAEVEVLNEHHTARAELALEISQAHHTINELRSHLESVQSELEAKDGDMSLQQGEAEQLRAELEAAQESISRLTAQTARMGREHERATADMQWQIDSLREQLSDRDTKLQNAFIDREMSSVTTADVTSRLSTYLSEIDRLKVIEATLGAEIAEARAVSAAETLRRVDVEKRVGKLVEEKQLLGVALESKELEVTLLQRQLGKRPGSAAGITTPTKRRLAVSTSRVPSTPSTSTGSMGGVGDTPGPAQSSSRRLSMSVHVSASGAAATRPGSEVRMRRESSVMGTPVIQRPTPSSAASGAVTRRPSIHTPTPASRGVLGASTRHNAPAHAVSNGEATPKAAGSTAGKKVGTGSAAPRKSMIPVPSPGGLESRGGGAQEQGQGHGGGLRKQTSMPVLHPRSTSSLSRTSLRSMADIDESEAM